MLEPIASTSRGPGVLLKTPGWRSTAAVAPSLAVLSAAGAARLRPLAGGRLVDLLLLVIVATCAAGLAALVLLRTLSRTSQPGAATAVAVLAALDTAALALVAALLPDRSAGLFDAAHTPRSTLPTSYLESLLQLLPVTVPACGLAVLWCTAIRARGRQPHPTPHRAST